MFAQFTSSLWLSISNPHILPSLVFRVLSQRIYLFSHIFLCKFLIVFVPLTHYYNRHCLLYAQETDIFDIFFNPFKTITLTFRCPQSHLKEFIPFFVIVHEMRPKKAHERWPDESNAKRRWWNEWVNCFLSVPVFWAPSWYCMQYWMNVPNPVQDHRNTSVPGQEGMHQTHVLLCTYRAVLFHGLQKWCQLGAEFWNLLVQ